VIAGGRVVGGDARAAGGEDRAIAPAAGVDGRAIQSTRRGRRTLAAVIVAVSLAGCANVPRGEAPLGGDTLAGRLSIRIDEEMAPARSLTAGFELRGDPRAGRLELSTPLGSVLAQARWSPTRVVLATPRGETEFTDLDALTREVLGESLPVAALFDWLRGRPWPGAPSRPVTGGFEQLGWTVDLSRFDEALVAARRADPLPVTTVRIKLDRP
jgi:outer membrane lipoprotein LolB